jgi:hypothetical protein
VSLLTGGYGQKLGKNFDVGSTGVLATLARNAQTCTGNVLE